MGKRHRTRMELARRIGQLEKLVDQAADILGDLQDSIGWLAADVGVLRNDGTLLSETPGHRHGTRNAGTGESEVAGIIAAVGDAIGGLAGDAPSRRKSRRAAWHADTTCERHGEYQPCAACEGERRADGVGMSLDRLSEEERRAVLDGLGLVTAEELDAREREGQPYYEICRMAVERASQRGKIDLLKNAILLALARRRREGGR